MADPIASLNAALAGRYEIERQIGQGGMATVYLAEDRKHHRKVALKFLKPELAAIIGADRFLAEIETTAHLQHPNILPLFDSGEADGSVFFVMPYLEEETLQGRLSREKQLPVDEAVRIAREVAEALDYAHRAGVIHRDIKPANILLRDGRPLVGDFGIALAASRSGNRLTETGLSLGTPFYMSPEQATGSQEIGPAADIYALGCVLYEMLVGEPPHTGSTLQAVLAKIITGEAKPVTGQRRSVPLNVDSAITKAIEKLPADRFGTAKEFARALTDPGFRYGERAGTAGTGERVGPLRAWAVTASGLAAVLAVVTGWSLFRPEPPKPVARFALVPPSGVDIPGGPNGIQGFAVSPDGRTVVFADGPTGQLYRQEVGQLDAEPIPGAKNAWGPFFSPDGEWIGFIDQVANTVKKTRLDGSQAQTLVTVSPPGRTATWSSDGTIIVHSDALGGLWRVPDTGGDLEAITETGGLELRWLDVLPNGRGVVTSLGDSVVAISLETGEMTSLFRGLSPRFISPGYLLYWRENSIWAVPFDPERLQTNGSAMPVVEGVGIGVNDLAEFAVGGGTLFYRQSALTLGRFQTTPLWIGRDGVEEVLDTLLSGSFRTSAISPDGRKIAFAYIGPGETEQHIWIYDLGQRTFSRLTFEGTGNLQPFWSPDGTEVGFSSNLAGRFALYTRPVDLSKEARLLRADPDADLMEGAWTPDGSRLVYRRETDIWHSPPEPGGDAVAIVETLADESHPALSPDGRWLAYASNEEGWWEVYIRPFPGPGGRVKVSTDGGVQPRWARSGNEVFYLAFYPPWTAGPWTGASIRTDPTPLVESRVERFPNSSSYLTEITDRFWDVSPDDQRALVMALPASEGRYVVVENFGEELRRPAPE